MRKLLKKIIRFFTKEKEQKPVDTTPLALRFAFSESPSKKSRLIVKNKTYTSSNDNFKMYPVLWGELPGNLALPEEIIRVINQKFNIADYSVPLSGEVIKSFLNENNIKLIIHYDDYLTKTKPVDIFKWGEDRTLTTNKPVKLSSDVDALKSMRYIDGKNTLCQTTTSTEMYNDYLEVFHTELSDFTFPTKEKYDAWMYIYLQKLVK
jgi:hypothetical protein